MVLFLAAKSRNNSVLHKIYIWESFIKLILQVMEIDTRAGTTKMNGAVHKWSIIMYMLYPYKINMDKYRVFSKFRKKKKLNRLSSHWRNLVQHDCLKYNKSFKKRFCWSDGWIKHSDNRQAFLNNYYVSIIKLSKMKRLFGNIKIY